MRTIAVIRAIGFSLIPSEEFSFMLVMRAAYHYIILEEKNTSSRYRIEYDNNFRTVNDVVQEVIEELRTREFDKQGIVSEPDFFPENYYRAIISGIVQLIESGQEAIRLTATPNDEGSVFYSAQETSLTLSLGDVIAEEIRNSANFVQADPRNTKSSNGG